jgi:hypothetical protein
MAKKETASTSTNIKTDGNHNNIHVHVGHPKKEQAKKEKKPNWVVKIIVGAAIGLICSIILIYVKNSTASNGKPAYIQGGSAPIEKDK